MASYDQYYNDPALTGAREESQGAMSNVANMSQSVSVLPYKLRDAINEKLDYNRDLIEQKNKAMEDYFAAPAEGRQQYQDIWNPMQREALVSRNTAQKYTPYANLQDILSTRQGGIADLIGAAGAQGRSDLELATNNAQLLRQQYQDLLGEADKRTALDLDVARLNKSGAGDDSGGFDLEALLAMMGGDTSGMGADSQYEKPPMSTMVKGMEREWPPGSGVVWVSNGQGGWE